MNSLAMTRAIDPGDTNLHFEVLHAGTPVARGHWRWEGAA